MLARWLNVDVYEFYAFLLATIECEIYVVVLT